MSGFHFVNKELEGYLPYKWKEILSAAMAADDKYMLKCEFDTRSEAQRVANLAQQAKYRYGLGGELGVSLKGRNVYIYRKGASDE